MLSISTPVALVTDAHQAIGTAVAHRLCKHGFRVYLGGRDGRRGTEAENELRAHGLDVQAVQLDVTDPISIVRVLAQIADEAGRLDVLVNSARLAPPQTSASECEVQSLRDSYDVNVFGTISVTQTMLPLLRLGGSRVIVNLSGEPEPATQADVPASARDWLSHASSDAALAAFTESLAKELHEEGFHVHSVDLRIAANEADGARCLDRAADLVARYALPDAANVACHWATEDAQRFG